MEFVFSKTSGFYEKFAAKEPVADSETVDCFKLWTVRESVFGTLLLEKL